jgi:hypothetical protein
VEQSLLVAWGRLERSKGELLGRVAVWSPPNREWRPSPASWSLAEVVEHCYLVEMGIRTALAKDPTPGKPRVMKRGQWLRWGVMRAVLLLGIKYRAPVDVILPRRDVGWEDLQSRWEVERGKLKEWLERSDPAIHPDPRFRHPLAGWLTVPQTVTFVADHLDHHLQQLGRIERLLARR